MRQTQGRILVIRGGAIGDFVLTLPAIAALRNRFPQAHLEVLGYPQIVSLAVAGGLVDRVRSIEAGALAAFFGRNATLSPDLADYFSEFDLILSYLYDPDAIFQTNVSRCTGAQFIVGPHRPGDAEPLHAAQTLLKPLERLAIFDADPVPRLQLASTDRIGNRLAMHPGSGSERKNWPEKHWADLLSQLIDETPLDLLLVGGEAEGERLQRLAAALPPARFKLARSLPLPELAGLLKGCAGYVGHDSGISHLAAAVGLPAVILWADSAEHVWRPAGAHITVLRCPGGLHKLPAREVLHKLLALNQPAPG